MATFEIDIYSQTRTAQNGKTYIELPAGRFTVGDVLTFSYPEKPARRSGDRPSRPAFRARFVIAGTGQIYEPDYDEVSDGRRFAKVFQRYYGTLEVLAPEPSGG